MTPEEKDYLQYRLTRANETLQAAELLLENNHLYDAVNRTYYACFHAVSALLLTEGRSSAKHSGVRSLFDRHWVNVGRVPASMGPFYRKLFKYRQKADYERVSFNREEVTQWLNDAETFVAHISNHIEQLLQADQGQN